MRNLTSGFIVLISVFVLSCTYKSKIKIKDKLESNDKVEVVNSNTEEVDTLYEVPPPPNSVLQSPILTLSEWFSQLCSTETPKGADVYFRFGLFETSDRYAIYLIKYKEQETWNSSKPDGIKYFSLAKNNYKGLPWTRVLEKIKLELKELASMARFKNSPLAQAKSITIKFDDEDILKLK